MKTLLYKLIVLFMIATFLLSACGGEEIAGDDDVYPAAAEEAEVSDLEPTESPDEEEPTAAVAPSGDLPQWTILMYLDADDDVLEEDIFTDLNEAEMVGSTDQMQIVALLDRFDGAFDGDGDWTGAKRYFVTQDADLETIGSEELDDLGEIDMGDPQTLVDFVTWGIETYPAQKYALILSDHGSGWPGGWSDPDPVEGSELFLSEIVQALSEIHSLAGGPLEFFGMDACLMSQIEVYTAVQPYARFAVASQETEPALGWAYASWMGRLADDPGMDGAQVARNIVDTYIVDDQRVLDDQARSTAFGRSTAEQIIRELGNEITLSAVDLEQLTGVLSALDNLTAAMSSLDQELVAEARTYAQSYESIFSQDEPSPYIDLGHFAQLLAEISGDGQVAGAADELMAAIQQALVAEKHGDGRPGSTGFTIFFPVSSLYGAESLGAEDYVAIAYEFAQASSWDEFLAFHYTGEEFAPQPGQAASAPDPSAVAGPGASAIDLLPVEISTESVGGDESVELTCEVTGKNIAYVYTFVGLVDEITNAVLVMDMDFVFTDDTKQVGGVYYPDFSAPQPFPLQWEWTPTIFNLNDGSLSAFALFEPEDYGPPDQPPTYSVYGIYRPADGSQPSYAVLTFADGELLQVFAYSDENGEGAPWEILPNSGDQFTVLHTILTEDENGVVMTSYQEGDTFTFGEDSFTWEEVPAPAGNYVVGFIAVDFDGNEYAQFAPIEVRE